MSILRPPFEDLLAAGRVAALQDLTRHPNKKHAKEARRCLHILRTRGVDAPLPPPVGEPARPARDQKHLDRQRWEETPRRGLPPGVVVDDPLDRFLARMPERDDRLLAVPDLVSVDPDGDDPNAPRIFTQGDSELAMLLPFILRGRIFRRRPKPPEEK